MEKRESQDRAKRLLAYSAAASLGAFAFGQQADAEVIHTDIVDITLNTRAIGAGYEINVNVDRDNDIDFVFRFVPWGAQYASIRGVDAHDNLALTNVGKGNSYYVRSFDVGDVIGFENSNVAVCTGYDILKPAASAPGFGRDVDSYMAIALREEGGSDFYFGWVRVQVLWDGTLPQGVTVYEFAYETQPNTAIIAGATPEPGSLGLLAAGAGAMAFRRRKAS